MKVKIDTKEKFHIITIQERHLSANMTEELNKEMLLFLEKDLKNVVLKMIEVKEIDELVAVSLVNIQQKFYDNNASFVVCEISSAIEQYLDKLELLEMMNITPTESEAWDIVQLEEIERELLPPNPLKGGTIM
ncbi:MAG: STAS domain-containing protein [Ginsengibacter sp.]